MGFNIFNENIFYALKWFFNNVNKPVDILFKIIWIKDFMNMLLAFFLFKKMFASILLKIKTHLNTPRSHQATIP